MDSTESSEIYCGQCRQHMPAIRGRCTKCGTQSKVAQRQICRATEEVSDASRAVEELQVLCAPLRKSRHEARVDAALFFASTVLFIPMFLLTAIATKRWGYVEWR